MWREAWHWLTTSRYTRRLESEIKQLTADNDRLRGDNDGLLRALYPAIRAIRTEHDTHQERPVTSNGNQTFKW